MRKKRSNLVNNLMIIFKKTFTDKNFYKECLKWEIIKGYLLHLLGTLLAGLLPGLIILWLFSLQSNFSVDWNTFWSLLPYFVTGGLIIGMITAKKMLQSKLSILGFIVMIFVFVPIDIFTNGIKAVLQFAGIGFILGLFAYSVQFMVFTMHYDSKGMTKITDNFNKDNFIGAFCTAVFISIIGVLGHSIINLFKMFSR